MLRRVVSLLSGRAACLCRQPVTAAATLSRRHPDARLGAVDARGYRRMARRILPVRPDGYSTSDGEADACRDDEGLEPAAGADGEEEVEWGGFSLDLKSGTIEDASVEVDEDEDEDEDEEEEEEEEGEK